MIPQQAVQAAADALRDAFDWGETNFEKQARAALEAAAPRLMAGAYDQAVEDSQAYASVMKLANPYRIQP